MLSIKANMDPTPHAICLPVIREGYQRELLICLLLTLYAGHCVLNLKIRIKKRGENWAQGKVLPREKFYPEKKSTPEKIHNFDPIKLILEKLKALTR